jgi:tetratricopeptide (TPR) repeat protein
MRILFSVLALGLTLSGCATTEPGSKNSTFDSAAKERARVYLKDLTSVDFRYSNTGRSCATPLDADDWKMWVLSAGACVQKGDWNLVENLGTDMASREVDSPWGAYFLGLAAIQKGEFLRAHWLLDLAEKKAGGPIGIVRYEKARLLEREEGPSSAAKEMKEAVRLEATLVAGHLWLAQVYHRDRVMADAEKYYRQALEVKSDLWPALAGLSEILIDKNDGIEAANMLSRALILRPESAEIRVKLAHVYENMTKEPAKALQTLRELRVAMEKGRAKGRVGFDLNTKIMNLEKSLKPTPVEQAREREPAESKKGG